MTYDITSPGNERIRWLTRLRDRKERDNEGLFVVEGERLHRRALSAGLVPEVVFTDGSVDLDGGVVTVAPEVLDKASYRQRSQGVISVFGQFDTALETVEVSSNPLILIAEDIEKPGNLGAMMRTAAAAGADALITVGATVDPFNPNAIRSSTGALFTLPLAVSSWAETAPWLAEQRIEMIGTSPDAEPTIWDTSLTTPVALVIGSEDRGLSEQAVSIAGQMMAIPQGDRGVDSLNASVAAAVVLFEAVRQRTEGV